ncbi:MAG TPA: 3-deoxy-7-phosphoheptulonate synthase [Chloroflexia bacterium]|nr:3-deoxy-7-phosphoheptulonate synthase [Chloroflexia bacterium]
MIIIMKATASARDVAAVAERVRHLGYAAEVGESGGRVLVSFTGDMPPIEPDLFSAMPGVDKIVPLQPAYRLASRAGHPHDTVIRVGDALIGGRDIAFMAGPCSVEDRGQTLEVADALAALGVKILRGGAFKPRTSPYSFQGLHETGLEILSEVRERTGMAIVTEVLAPADVPLVAAHADILQIGTRNMQNYALLEAVGAQSRPVLLKRGMSATIEEWLLAAEYILSQGNSQVMLCERGIRSFDKSTRGVFDVTAIPLLKRLTHLPVIADPSHATGHWDLVAPVAKAAVAAGADGLIVEVHAHPDQALSDGTQSLRPARAAALIDDLRRLAAALDRSLDLAPLAMAA